jgi:membrane peptidoglycan carboxypeptidase
MDLHTDSTPSTDFFNSLPPGVFDETRDIEADGQLQYALHFRLDSSTPDSVEFDSRMRKIKFHLRKSGKENLYKMNGAFLHTVYEYEFPYKTFIVGDSNPDFTPLEQVGKHLRNAILTSEDGSFFFHNGFNEEAFRKSIAENYRRKKFVRGGSTISMQLVKNVFLSRHKTIARKAEEALIVWLIESNRLTSKERMFEVYLNIIELGPGIYGVGDASRFYFNKRPSELTLSESIFLASLLPHPKWFKYSFDMQGNLKPYLADYYRVVSNFMLRKNLITQEEYDSIVPNVVLKGIAHEMVVPSDTIPAEEDE